MARVFVSYSRRDKQFVEHELIPLLQDNGIETWHDTKDVPAGRDWEREIVDALEACDWFLVVLSPDAVDSPRVRDEVQWAIESRKSRIIPVLLMPCKVEQLALRLKQLQHVDFTGDPNAARTKLLEAFHSSPRRPADGQATAAPRTVQPRPSAASSATPARQSGSVPSRSSQRHQKPGGESRWVSRLAALTVILLIAWAVWDTYANKMVAVPNVFAQSKETADQAIRDGRLIPEAISGMTIQQAYDREREERPARGEGVDVVVPPLERPQAGAVYDQEPKAGQKVQVGATVRFWYYRP